MSDANRVGLRYIEETTWNSLPAAPAMTPIRYTGESMIPSVENIVSAEIRDDRMITDLIQVSRSNTGGFEIELSAGTFDELIAGALFSDWVGDSSSSGDIIRNGVTRHSFSIEKAMLDIDEYFLFTGMMVNSMTWTLATSSIAVGSFDMLGSGATLGQSSNANSVNAASTTAVLNCMGNVASLKEGSSLTTMAGIYVQELSFTIANNLRPVHQIGSNTIAEIAVGKCDITGTLNAYFTNDRLFDQFLAGTATQIEFKIMDGAGNYYTVLFPEVKFETESVVAPGQDQDVIENLTWRALRDATEDAMIKITRNLV